MFNVNSLISFTEFYSGMVINDDHVDLSYEHLFVTLDDVYFHIVYEL